MRYGYDHDHFCLSCRAWWGCKDSHCHLPTEEYCPDHGGGWDTEAVEHVHECSECEDHDAEAVSCFDWIHIDKNCSMSRKWLCPKHRRIELS